MSKKVDKLNAQLESALSEFISQISGKTEDSAKTIATKFLNQIEKSKSLKNHIFH